MIEPCQLLHNENLPFPFSISSYPHTAWTPLIGRGPLYSRLIFPSSTEMHFINK
jgi:hypothetical protein